MINLYYALLQFLLLSLPIYAKMNTGIKPVYDDENGIRARIIQSKCLHCHLSSLREVNVMVR